MRMKFKSSLFLLVISILLGNAPLWADESAANESTANGEAAIIVTGTRSEQEAIVVPAAIAVISREAILASGATHVTEVLRSRGGIQLSDLYGDGSEASVSMRGFGDSANANTLVLVDGRRLNNPDMGPPDLNSVALKDVERIEIIQGSGSVLYGDQAVGGVINIITRKPAGFVIGAELLTGSYDRQALQAHISNAFDNGLSFRISAESREADNYREHNAVEYKNLFTRVDYNYAGGGIFLEYQAVDDNQQTPAALLTGEVRMDRRQSHSDFANDYSDIQSDIERLGVQQGLSEHWTLLAEYTHRKADGEFLLSFRGFPALPEPPNTQDRELNSFNPRLAGRYETANGPLLLTLGVDHEESDYFLGSQLGTQQSEQKTRSYYIQGVLPVLASTDLMLGYRSAAVENDLIDRPAFGSGVPDDADLDDDLSIFSAGITVYASESLRHFIRYEETYRFAKVDEHTASPIVPDFFGQSGPPLQTQTGESTELGVQWSRDKNYAQAVIFRLDLENEIIFDTALFQNINIDSTRRDGAILEFGRQLTERLQLGLSYSYLDAQIRSGTFAGNTVPFTAEDIAGVNIDYSIGENWHIYSEAHYISGRVFSGDFAGALAELEGYTTVNGRLEFSPGRWTVALRVNNLLDEEYSDSGTAVTLFNPPTFLPETVASFYPAPGRNGWLSVGYTFE
jgi:iron complex outermembrane receptor protein